MIKYYKFHIGFIVLLFHFVFNVSAQLSYTFTPCGATGSLGPTQSQVTNTYQGTSLQGQVTATAGIQYWTVPITGAYRCSALGAQGGGANGGNGALIEGDFNLTAGSIIRIVVGQQGITQSGEPNSCGGGGGSYVVNSQGNGTVNILVIAGGGGGSAGTYSNSRFASLTTTGNYGAGVDNTDGAGGIAGGGGNKSVSANSLDRAAGGGGFFTDGQSIGQTAGAANGGKAFLNGSEGGSTNQTGAPGSFGGGGAVWQTGFRGAGGGGGFSGGGGGQTNANVATQVGGGGGSFNNGTNQTAAVSTATGDGRVIFTELCPLKIWASGTNSLAPILCSGSTLSLMTNGVSNYSWSTGNTTSSIIAITPGQTTTYTVTATTSINCTTSAMITVTVNAAVPVLSITTTTTSICLGDSVKLNVSGALTHSWTNNVVNNKFFYPIATTIYTASGQNGCGITTGTVAVAVAPLQVGIASTHTSVCASNPVTLTSTGANSYTWSTAQNGSLVIAAPSGPTTYTVVGKLGNCFGTNSISIQTKANPTLNIVASSSVLCSGKSVTLTVSGAISYTWVQPGLTYSVEVVQPASPTLYQVSGSNSLGCIGSANQAIITQASPTVNLVGGQPTICPGATGTITVGGAHTYSWSNGSGGNILIASALATTVYTVTGTYTTNQCSNESTFTVFVDQPFLSVSPSTTVCPGTALTLTAGGTGHSWSNGFTFAFNPITASVAMLYTVSANVITSSNLICNASNSVYVGLFPSPVVTATASRAEICRFEKSILTASGANTYTWLNNGTNGSSTTFSLAQVTTHTYLVVGTDLNGCMDTAAVTVKVNLCTGISELNANGNVYVYPNPNSGLFIIEGASNNAFTVTNQLGQVVRTFVVNSNNFKVDLSDLAPGVYYLNADTDKGKIDKKIIIQN